MKRCTRAPWWLFCLVLVATVTSCGGSKGGEGTGTGPGPSSTDPDGDGLSTEQELTLGTDPFDPDTDADDLDDGSEVVRGTDPTKEDTDADDLVDGLEVRLGTNPRVPDLLGWFSGRCTLPDGAPAYDVSIEVDHAALDVCFEGLCGKTDASGLFLLGPWPGTVVSNVALKADLTEGGVFYSAREDVSQVGAGVQHLPDVVLRPQPYTRGTDFYIAVPWVPTGSGERQVGVLAFMNNGTGKATVRWEVPGLGVTSTGARGVVTVDAGESVSVSVPADVLSVRNTKDDSIKSVPYGIRVTSDRPVSVALHSYDEWGDNGSMSAFACLPEVGARKELLPAGAAERRTNRSWQLLPGHGVDRQHVGRCSATRRRRW